MSKIKLQYESKELNIEHQHDGDLQWPELVDGFINFLRGIGYQIENGEYVEHDARVSIDRLEELEQKERQTYIPEEFNFVKEAIDSIQVGAAVVDIGTITHIGNDYITVTSEYNNITTYHKAHFISLLVAKEITIVNR